VQRKNQKNKVLPHPILARGLNLDTLRPNLLLAASLSQREDKKPRKSETVSMMVQHTQPSQLTYPRNYVTSQSMQEGMRVLSETWQMVPPQAPGEQEKNSKRAR
jgi:hypothetical protein